MLFFTRERYEFQQRRDVPSSERAKNWNEAVAAAQEHYAVIKPRLHADMAAFVDITLHDGVIDRVDRPTVHEVILEIDGRHCPWGPRGLFTLSFRGAKCVDGLDECVGARWLYNEVHLHPEANFDYQVLLRKVNEILQLRLVADGVDFRITEPGPTPIMGVNVPLQAKDGLYVWTNLDESGTTMGWCCISADGHRVAKPLSPELRTLLRKFAAGIGAIIPDEVKENPIDETGGLSN